MSTYIFKVKSDKSFDTEGMAANWLAGCLGDVGEQAEVTILSGVSDPEGRYFTDLNINGEPCVFDGDGPDYDTPLVAVFIDPDHAELFASMMNNREDQDPGSQ